MLYFDFQLVQELSTERLESRKFVDAAQNQN